MDRNFSVSPQENHVVKLILASTIQCDDHAVVYRKRKLARLHPTSRVSLAPSVKMISYSDDEFEFFKLLHSN